MLAEAYFVQFLTFPLLHQNNILSDTPNLLPPESARTDPAPPEPAGHSTAAASLF